ncbi:MAG: metal-sulfur cluster assembly factor [Candidatus Pacebacteria bacterium]|nr:metal-sulfur cluster assembly factor [Candidatus Paceibacterota bacterium]PIR63633.1 MAG: aromatic ring hydroxylase [Candidatus Pacebacteria bacterium CG10_big_fil_rev_8_21_14_0_10_40_26]PIZ78735.1 MAG: aromatic ring hydroxylase [Candidatus Pacebacteria bacterium CG_4_10_14_0_2_um_filter_40_20]PJA68413.1 MAG: aromatic ring hydroxylase [Candidatus Pacebacteria bacterium CG_4_9_14_3_um_filter_40_12]PJC41275.1 MAG: aromatic ring hydroxylase [Candidatus Pacebacteria bacterium CG_4_9_14_0_2_um_fi
MLLESTHTTITEKDVMDCLTTVIDPELHIDIVSMGLVYGIDIRDIQTDTGTRPWIHVLLTLTTPGCPLAAMFDTMIKDALAGLPGVDVQKDITVELTFDPPWVPDMMTEEARAELGFD